MVDGDRVGAALAGQRLVVAVVHRSRPGLRVDQVHARVRVLVDGGDDQPGRWIRGHAVTLADDVPLAYRVAAEVELDDGAVPVTRRARLALRPDAVLEPDEDVGDRAR